MTSTQLISQITKVGAIADPRVSDRRLIPFLTLDCNTNTNLEKAIELHEGSEVPGDIVCTWSWQRFSKKNVYLKLEFKRPFHAIAHIAFDVKKHGYVVDWIRGVHGTYLQSSKYGSSVSEGLGNPAILIEVPHDATFPIWDDLYNKSIRKQLISQGIPKKNLARAIEDHKNLRREFWNRFSTGA